MSQRGEMHRKFEWQVRVYYEDTGAVGVVFHANYLCYMERARTEWFRSIGFEYQGLFSEYGIVFAVKKLSIDYIQPVRLDDLLKITSAYQSRRGASIQFHQQINNNRQELISQAEIKVACLNAKTLRPTAVLDAIVTELK